MMANDDIAANIGPDDPYHPGGRSKAAGPVRTYEHSTKIRDVGANAEPGHPSAPAPFVNPDPSSTMINSAWNRKTNG
jgi:hypothetical protein